MATSRVPEFQARFRELRGEVTQEQFAKKIGVSRPTIGLYESGARIPDAEILRDICLKCNVSSDWLLGISEVISPNPNMQIACEYTGLTEKAVVRLITLTNTNRVLTSAVIESQCFGGMESPRIEGLIDYLDEAITTCEEVEELTFSLSSCFDDGGKLQNEELYVDTYADLIYRLRELRGLKFEVMEAAAKILNDLAPVDNTIIRAQEAMEISKGRLQRQAEEYAGHEK